MGEPLINRTLAVMQETLGKYSLCTSVAVKVRNQMDRIIGAHLNDGIFPSQNGELWLINKMASKAKVFVDVGANVGAWSKAFIAATGAQRGLLFEPSLLALARLRETLQDELMTGVVEVVEAAVSENRGTADFYMEENAGETSSLISSFSMRNAQKISVRITTIDEECESRGLPFVDFLKIDAEGYDFQVLKGARNCLAKKHFGVIQFEYNAPWANSSSTLLGALDYLNRYDYKVYLLKHRGLYHFDYNKYGEYFHYGNFVAVAPGYFEVNALSL